MDGQSLVSQRLPGKIQTAMLIALHLIEGNCFAALFAILVKQNKQQL